MAEVVSYLVSASCIDGMSWVVFGTMTGPCRRRKNRRVKRALAGEVTPKG